MSGDGLQGLQRADPPSADAPLSVPGNADDLASSIMSELEVRCMWQYLGETLSKRSMDTPGSRLEMRS